MYNTSTKGKGRAGRGLMRLLDPCRHHWAGTVTGIGTGYWRAPAPRHPATAARSYASSCGPSPARYHFVVRIAHTHIAVRLQTASDQADALQAVPTQRPVRLDVLAKQQTVKGSGQTIHLRPLVTSWRN